VHELSVAQRLVELVEERLDGEGAVRVTIVHLRLGPLAGVVPEALLFAFDAATENTACAGARLAIEPVEPTLYCPGCGMERPLLSVQRLSCRVCGTVTPHVVRGRELEVTEVEVVDAAEDRAGSPAGAEEERRARPGAA
jgi:hydrogenase nickel incorporation protein HypA/HybF